MITSLVENEDYSSEQQMSQVIVLNEMDAEKSEFESDQSDKHRDR